MDEGQVEQRARELLAAEYKAEFSDRYAKRDREGNIVGLAPEESWLQRADNSPASLRAIVKALSTTGGWQAMDSAPKDGTHILAIWRYNPEDPDAGRNSHEVVRWCGWWDAAGFTQPEPTHWMPLPSPPAA